MAITDEDDYLTAGLLEKDALVADFEGDIPNIWQVEGSDLVRSSDPFGDLKDRIDEHKQEEQAIEQELTQRASDVADMQDVMDGGDCVVMSRKTAAAAQPMVQPEAPADHPLPNMVQDWFDTNPGKNEVNVNSPKGFFSISRPREDGTAYILPFTYVQKAQKPITQNLDEFLKGLGDWTIVKQSRRVIVAYLRKKAEEAAQDEPSTEDADELDEALADDAGHRDVDLTDSEKLDLVLDELEELEGLMGQEDSPATEDAEETAVDDSKEKTGMARYANMDSYFNSMGGAPAQWPRDVHDLVPYMQSKRPVQLKDGSIVRIAEIAGTGELTVIAADGKRRSGVFLRDVVAPKQATIEHSGDQWVVKSKDGDKTLGKHDTKEGADDQLKAIEVHKHGVKTAADDSHEDEPSDDEPTADEGSDPPVEDEPSDDEPTADEGSDPPVEDEPDTAPDATPTVEAPQAEDSPAPAGDPVQDLDELAQCIDEHKAEEKAIQQELGNVAEETAHLIDEFRDRMASKEGDAPLDKERVYDEDYERYDHTVGSKVLSPNGPAEIVEIWDDKRTATVRLLPSGELRSFRLNRLRGEPTKTAVTPPGHEKQVKELKKHPEVENPWAVAWDDYDKEQGKTPKKGVLGSDPNAYLCPDCHGPVQYQEGDPSQPECANCRQSLSEEQLLPNPAYVRRKGAEKEEADEEGDEVEAMLHAAELFDDPEPASASHLASVDLVRGGHSLVSK